VEPKQKKNKQNYCVANDDVFLIVVALFDKVFGRKRRKKRVDFCEISSVFLSLGFPEIDLAMVLKKASLLGYKKKD
jgi:hypothetical protein